MKNLEKYLQLGFLAIMGFLIYLGMGVYDRSVAPGTDVEPIPSFTRTESTGLQFEPQKIDNKGIFLIDYENESISQTRNIFKSRIILAEAGENAKDLTDTSGAKSKEEKVVTVSKPEPPVAPSSEKEKKAEQEEPLPTVAMKGVVFSENRQALILDVDGKIQILTSDKPLPSGFSLVRITKNQAILAYKGREIKLNF